MDELKTPEIYGAVNKIMEEVKPVAKNKGGRDGGDLKYKYRGIEDIYNAVQPIFTKNGVFNAIEVLERNDSEYKTASGSVWNRVRLKIRYRFFAKDGSFIDVVLWGEGNDNGDKGSNKALSQAHKYAICQLLCLPYEAKEEDAEVAENVSEDLTPEQHKQKSMEEVVKAFPGDLKAALKKAGMDSVQKAFKAYQQVEGDLDALFQMCQEKIKGH